MGTRFSDKAQRVILIAQEEAKRLNHDYVGTEHMLLGLIVLSEGMALRVLRNLGTDLHKVRTEIEKTAAPPNSRLLLGEIPFTPRAKKVLEYSVEEAQRMSHYHIGTEHILLGLIREEEGAAARLLGTPGLKLETVREEVLNILADKEKEGSGAEQDKPRERHSRALVKAKAKTPLLDEFARDMTQMARDGGLDPVIGRSLEIDRVIQVLGRRTKNNPVLVGEPGVGKTAIVEGLASMIASGDIPDTLAGKRLLSLDLASLVAGTKYRGEFEQRLKGIIEEIRKGENSIIMFIDELHTVIGAGGAEGAIDASNMLKPALARGELQCIGATTFDEFRKHIEHDPALERRFQPVVVESPKVEETVAILNGLKEKYESHHKCRYSAPAILAAAALSDKYITDRALPDKAIDLLDEAGSRARLKLSLAPAEFKTRELEIAEAARQKSAALFGHEYARAALMRDREKELQTTLDDARKKWREGRDNVLPEVTEEDIAYIASKWTGIPVTRMTEKETDRLLHMEDELHKRLVAQQEAVRMIAQAIKRSRTGMKDAKRPIGNFIFLGPTGVGKTELARVLADFLFGNEDAMVRIDMSEYMEKFSVSRLIGAPPGYVGYEEGGKLTEIVRRKPYSVIVLDEIEKAHPDVFNILLQIMDEGTLTDSLGHKVSFKNTVIIMTSNVGARLISKGKTLGFMPAVDKEKDYQEMKDTVMEEVKRVFNPEFINRLDEVIVFRPLTEADTCKILDLTLLKVDKKLEAKGIKFTITGTAKAFLVKRGFDPNYGARPLLRTVQKYLEDPMSEFLINSTVNTGNIIEVDYKGEGEALDLHVR